MISKSKTSCGPRHDCQHALWPPEAHEFDALGVANRQLICSLCDKSMKIYMYIPLRPKFSFRGGDIEFSDLGSPWGPFYCFPLRLGVIVRSSNFEKPYLHFQLSNFHKFGIKLFRKERSFKEKKGSTKLLRQNTVV